MPPLYMPSSGRMDRVKFRISSGLGKVVFMVEPSESSERSVVRIFIVSLVSRLRKSNSNYQNLIDDNIAIPS